MNTASIAIVGGGVIGASVAYHLAAKGVKDVLILDRGPGPGAGSTGVATGGFRAQFSTPINVRLSLLGREKLLRFKEEVGADPGYEPVGYLWIASSQEELEALRDGLRVQHDEGLGEAREITAEEVAALNPAVRWDPVLGGAFCPSDGYIRPMKILEGYLSAARKLGVRVRWGVDVTGVARGGDGRIKSLVTSRGVFSVGMVVNAAGAWAAGLARLAAVDLPVAPKRTQAAVTAPFEHLPASMPMTIFLVDGFHFRVREGRVVLLLPSEGTPGRPYDASVDPDWVAAVEKVAHARVPILRRATVEIAACRAGLYEGSPDKHAILGLAPGCPNLYLANGSSGHGVMHAPALGQLLAEIIADGAASTLDVSRLRPTRFAEGDPNPASELL